MAGNDNIMVSFRLNLNRDEDLEIYRFLSGDIIKNCFGDKSKFVKSALVRAIQGIKQDEENIRLVSEMNTQRAVMEQAMTSEADRIINAVKLIVRDEMEQIAGMPMTREKQVSAKLAQSVSEERKVADSVFGEIPEISDEDVSEDVMAFLEDL